MKDIAAVGLLQEPMARKSDSYYQLAFGHCRVDALRGLQRAGQVGQHRDRSRWRPSPTSRWPTSPLARTAPARTLPPSRRITAWARALREIPDVTIQGLADKVGIDRGVMSRYLDHTGSCPSRW